MSKRSKQKNIAYTQFLTRIQKAQAKGKEPGKITIPWQIFKYMSEGRYGETTKRLDTTFVADQTGGGYTPDNNPNQFITFVNPPIIQALNLVNQGTAISQRVGNKISLDHLKVTLNASIGGPLNTDLLPFRILVVYDRQPNGAYPLIQNILSQVDQFGVVTYNTGLFHSYELNPNNMERFSILYDQKITQPPVAEPTTIGVAGGIYAAGNAGVGGPTDQSWTRIEFCVPLDDLNTTFSAQTTSPTPLTIASITTGALYLICGADETFAEPALTWFGNARLSFHDN